MKLDNTIIYLVGHGGVGKYTIAKELVKRTGAKLVDNHLINNPVFSVIKADGITPLPQAVWGEVMHIRKAVLRSIRTLSPPYYSFVFTNMITEDDVLGRKGYAQIVRLARARKALYIPVRILCSAQALRQRKDTPDRRERFKEIDLSNIEWLLKHREVLKISHPNLLTLDVSNITAKQAADTILNHVKDRHARSNACSDQST